MPNRRTKKIETFFAIINTLNKCDFSSRKIREWMVCNRLTFDSSMLDCNPNYVFNLLIPRICQFNITSYRQIGGHPTRALTNGNGFPLMVYAKGGEVKSKENFMLSRVG
jgi:hypothetical protein